MNNHYHLRWPVVWALVFCAFLGSGCTKAFKAKRLLAAGERDYQAQRFPEAEVEYQSVLRFVPRDPTAIQRLGLIYFQQGRLPISYAYLNFSHQLSPNDSEVTLRLAQVLDEANHLKEAAQLSTQVISQDPGNEEAPLALADSARSPAEVAAARQQIEQAQLANPTNAGFSAALGMMDLRQNKPDAAKPELDKALQLDSKLSTAYLGLAGVCAAAKDYKGMEQNLKLAADVSPPRSAARLKYADFKIQTGSPQVGNQLLQDILRQAPDYLPALHMLMKLQFTEHDYSGCAATVGRILARDNDNFDALLESGNIYLAKRDGTNALQVFQRMDLKYPANAAVKCDLGAAYLLQDDKTHAVASLYSAIGLDPNYAPAALLLAELDIRTGNSGEAITVLNLLLQKQPDNARGQSELAQAYLVQGHPESALEVYSRMKGHFPKNPEIPFMMGTIYEQLRRLPEAYQAFEQALALAPDNPSALAKLTELDLIQKHYDDAKKRVAAQMQKYPDSAEPWALQAQIYWAQDQTNEAIQAFSKAITIDPASPPAYFSLARIYLDSHQEKQALDRLNALIAKTNDVPALLEIATIHQLAADYPAARDAYQKVLSFAPDSSVALNNLAYLYSEYLVDLPKAHQMAEKARELQPNNPHGADTFGWILYKEGQYPRALSLLQDSADKLPADPEVLTHLGMTYYMMEEEDLARLYLDRATANSRDYLGKNQALQCLKILDINPETPSTADTEALQKRLAEVPGDPVALNRLAAIDEGHSEPDKAAEIYQKILSQNSKDWRAALQLASLYAGPLHDDRKALDLAKSAHDLAPNEPRSAALLGKVVYRSGDYVWALSLLEEAADKLPDQPELLYDLAWAYYANGHTVQADAKMEAAVAYGDRLPSLNDARQFLAMRAATKDPSALRDANSQAQTILQKQPHYLPALMVTALADEQQGSPQPAVDIYTQILNDYPLFTPAMRQLAILYAHSGGNDGRAFDLAEKARDAFPDDLELERALGILASRRGDSSRSVQLLQDSEQKFSNDPELLYYLGVDFYKLKQPKDSKQALQRALALNLPGALAGDARRVLAELK